MPSPPRERACHSAAASIAACLPLALALGACALPPPLVPEADRAASAIGEAGAAGGREDPGAAHYLALAERELARTRLLLRVGDAQGARSWARRALADADVARMLSLEATVRAAAQRTEQDAQALSLELDGVPAARRPVAP